MLHIAHIKLAVMGLGCVGFPPAVGLGKQRSVVGFHIHTAPTKALYQGKDSALKVSDTGLAKEKETSVIYDLKYVCHKDNTVIKL